MGGIARHIYTFGKMRAWLILLVVGSALLLTSAAGAAGGALDTSFGKRGKVLTDLSGSGSNESTFSAAIQGDGKIIVTGASITSENLNDSALARYNSDGSLDTSFGSGGKVLTDFGADDVAAAVAIQVDGKIVTAGASARVSFNFEDFCIGGGQFCAGDFAVARYNSDGSLDTSFGRRGIVLTDFGRAGYDIGHAVAIQRDGKIVAAGSGSGDFALARYNSDGSLDTSFGERGKVLTDFSGDFDGVDAVAIQGDGKIVVAGSSHAERAPEDFALARYNSDGSLDTSFGSGGKVLTDFGGGSFDFAGGVAIQGDGKIVAAGTSTPFGFGVPVTEDFALARYNSDGSLDTSFGSGGEVLTDFGGDVDSGHAVAIQGDGKIVVAGVGSASDGEKDFALARYNSDGSLDASFGEVLTGFSGSPCTCRNVDIGEAVAIQGDGKIVVAGESDASGHRRSFDFDFALARYLGS